ncbi:hypothetical protein PBCV1_a089aL [Paramecium bursaria Chlorella virus 1]|uniref:Uncharacterized protein n=1 Tax=Paramecium bursaria Chlorella virus 1 TaxID=10506 RepID=F8TTX6_PBCV1|nr:hypothetical protein PBCV1_a089aL [Paramecium bursaria Chlorella virus 1]AEI70037.1 hypothetical protein [Paramecium bursaria Chlorella virus 1]
MILPIIGSYSSSFSNSYFLTSSFKCSINFFTSVLNSSRESMWFIIHLF